MIGKNYDHYRDLWMCNYEYVVMEQTKKKVRGSFNWLAFLSFPVWLGYRRMYLWFFVMSILFAALTFYEVYYDHEVSSGALLGTMLVMALMSKDFYF